MTGPDVPQRVRIEVLLERYDLFLFDAYGVLLTADGALAGAREVLHRLHDTKRPFFVVTNDASRQLDTLAQFYDSLGLPVRKEQILSSGALLEQHFSQSGLAGSRQLVLGPPDSHRLVTAAGGVLASPDDPGPIEGLVICDEAGYEIPHHLDDVLSRLFVELDAGRRVSLTLPNPDMLYPKAGGKFGIAAGSIALVVEDALRRRYGDNSPTFVRLGKPAPHLFEEAMARAGTRNAIMFGDQLDTDIRGAHAAGIASVLMATGISTWRAGLPEALTPTFVLESMQLESRQPESGQAEVAASTD